LHDTIITVYYIHDYSRLFSFEHINNTPHYSAVLCEGTEIARINLKSVSAAKKKIKKQRMKEREKGK
jgi:hypothetical protein